MDAVKDSDSRVRFLSDASQYLLAVSPSTSACIMAERLEVMENANLTPDQPKSSTVCLACGMKLLPGLTSHISIISRREIAKKTGDEKPNARRRAIPLTSRWQEECSNCRRITETPLTKPTRKETAKRTTLSKQPSRSSHQTNISHRTETSSQTSNRKRKKHKGLMSRLKEEEQHANSSPEFSLMDFMKAA